MDADNAGSDAELKSTGDAPADSDGNSHTGNGNDQKAPEDTGDETGTDLNSELPQTDFANDPMTGNAAGGDALSEGGTPLDVAESHTGAGSGYNPEYPTANPVSTHRISHSPILTL